MFWAGANLVRCPAAPWVAVFIQRRCASSKNYYDVLKVKRDCSNAEIKKAFIDLSKQLHPDRNPSDPTSHKKFVLVNEAYKVLGKPASRRSYDQYLKSPPKPIIHHSATWHNPPPNTTRGWNWYDSSAWRQNDPGETKPYYGIKGVKRISTKWIALGCVILAFFSGGVQLLSLRYRRVHITEVDSRDEQNAVLWLEARRRAEESGSKEAQLALFEKRQEEGGCPLCEAE